MEKRSTGKRLYFRATGSKICLFGIALAVVALASTLLLGRFWMMTLLAPLPLLGFGLSMLAFPGDVRVGDGIDWGRAWTGTRVVTRTLWLAGLMVGIALGMLLWMMVIPFVEITR